MLHSVLKFYCRVGFHFFFRKWKIDFIAPLPEAPIIFLANHPNTFLDAILIACSIDRKPWFIARGEVFRKKWSAYLLSQLRMLPFYRFRDGYHTLRKNEDIINRCAELLGRGESILLFPEGDNSLQSNLLPLQKGFVKIAEATLKAKPDLNLCLVPIGINYNSGLKGFGGTALINFGNPINYFEYYKDKPVEEVLNSTWQKMNELIVPVQKEKGFTQQSTNFFTKINSFYFLINNFILKLLIRFIVSFIKEEPMKNSVRFATGLFLIFPVYLIQSLVMGFLTGSVVLALFYFISLPLNLRAHLFWSSQK